LFLSCPQFLQPRDRVATWLSFLLSTSPSKKSPVVTI
jgi:hypothetical protein